MKIYKKDDKVIVELNLWQDSYDAIGEKIGQVSNLVGVICGDEQGISQSIDMAYKGKGPQIGDFLIKTDLDETEFKKLCKELGIYVYEYPVCAACRKVIYGVHTINDKGENIHEECEEENAWQKCVNCGTLYDNPLADICGSCFENA